MRLLRTKPGRLLVYGILAVELAVTLYSFIGGPEGLPKVRLLKNEQRLLAQAIEDIAADLKGLEKKIEEWHRYTFYREKLAREQLQMARADEIVYFTTSNAADA